MTEQGERRINQPRCDQAGEKEQSVGEGRRLRGQLGTHYTTVSTDCSLYTHTIRRKYVVINTPQRDI